MSEPTDSPAAIGAAAGAPAARDHDDGHESRAKNHLDDADQLEQLERLSDSEADKREAIVVQIAPKRGVGKRRSKTVKEREAAKGKKSGNPGIFVGESYDFLFDLLPDFVKMRDAGGRGKQRRFDDFKERVYTDFWQRFDWTQFATPAEKTQEAVVNKINNVSL